MFEQKQDLLVVVCKFFILIMTIFLNIYITFYLLTLVQLQFFFNKILFNNYKNISLVYINFYINKFSKYRILYFILFLSLSGLPPFILFFIKFNFLINILFKYNIFMVFFIFFIFFFNMLFYIQIFYNKNINYNIMLYKPSSKNYINYKIIYIITFYIFLILLSIFFFQDYFFIFKLIYIWQH